MGLAPVDGLFGVVAAIICGYFWPSGALCFAINVFGLILFYGFTADDTHLIKRAYSDRQNPEDRTKLAISGALYLYLDFINLFRFLLALFGSRE